MLKTKQTLNIVVFTRLLLRYGSLPHPTREYLASSLYLIQRCGMQEYHRWRFPLSYDDPGRYEPFRSFQANARPTQQHLSESGGDSTLLGLMYVQSDAQTGEQKRKLLFMSNNKAVQSRSIKINVA